MKARTFSISLIPGSPSTPEETSTAHGRTCRTASPTFSAVSPEERAKRVQFRKLKIHPSSGDGQILVDRAKI